MSPEIPGGENAPTVWINPIGGLGDMLMVSGVLNHVHKRHPGRRFNLIRRTTYLTFLKGHPAIAEIGFPPKEAVVLGVDYWAKEKLGPGNQRAYQVLARLFGLPTPIEEEIYVPGEAGHDPLLHDFIPWKKRNILIAPSSDSPRKMMHPMIWHRFVDYMRADGALVLQAGRTRDIHIKNAYSLLGLTTPHQLLLLLKKCDVVVTTDNFIMHAAHYSGARTVAVWGPTHHLVYGYPEQIHLQTPKACGLAEFEDCIGPSRNEGGRLYGTPCSYGENHCLEKLRPEALAEAVKTALQR